MKFSQLVREVGEWSQHNFGDNKGAGAFAPFVGIVEETAEITVAMYKAHLTPHDCEPVIDGHCDRMIYLADFCYRIGYTGCHDFVVKNEGTDDAYDCDIAFGQLAHAFLKFHQGIRGVDKTKLFEKVDLVLRLFVNLYEYDCDFIRHEATLTSAPLKLPVDTLDVAIEKVWSVVKKRDWKKNPTNANEVADAAAEKSGPVAQSEGIESYNPIHIFGSGY